METWEHRTILEGNKGTKTRDEVEGLQNGREFSQPLECLYQDMQTQEKTFSIAFMK